jgi:hypothetical protein
VRGQKLLDSITGKVAVCNLRIGIGPNEVSHFFFERSIKSSVSLILKLETFPKRRSSRLLQ